MTVRLPMLHLTASWLVIFVSAKFSQTLLLIGSSVTRFESHTENHYTEGIENKKNVKKQKRFGVFC